MNTNIQDNKNIYIFIDTNLFYTRRNRYDFANHDIDEIIRMRDKFNHNFLNNKKIVIHTPDLVLKEVQLLKRDRLVQDFAEILSILKPLGEKQLISHLEQIRDEIDEKLTNKKEEFILSNKIIVPTNCNNEYFENIVEKAINKQTPFKPNYDQKKKRHVGDNGFKDAVIWYSIVDYVKINIIEDAYIILLTNNSSDFKSEKLLEEFYQITGKHIEIYKENQEEFSNFILNQSNDTNIEDVYVSCIKIKEKVRINSIKLLPLDSNISSFIPKYVNAKEFKESFEFEIAAKLENIGFDVENLKFSYHEPSIEYINVALRNYKLWFLDILDIELGYDDGTIDYAYDPKDIQLSTFFNETKEDVDSFKKDVSTCLEKQGYGQINPKIINYEIVEFIHPND